MNNGKHPVLDFAGRRRISQSAAVSSLSFDATDGDALALELARVRAGVEQKAAGLDVTARVYYITYEAIIDEPGTDDGGSTGSGSLRTPADWQTARLVLGDVRKAAAA